ncbi:hypothetical protein MRX96_007719 [Rhipicephalus microplus]
MILRQFSGPPWGARFPSQSFWYKANLYRTTDYTAHYKDNYYHTTHHADYYKDNYYHATHHADYYKDNYYHATDHTADYKDNYYHSTHHTAGYKANYHHTTHHADDYKDNYYHATDHTADYQANYYHKTDNETDYQANYYHKTDNTTNYNANGKGERCSITVKIHNYFFKDVVSTHPSQWARFKRSLPRLCPPSTYVCTVSDPHRLTNNRQTVYIPPDGVCDIIFYDSLYRDDNTLIYVHDVDWDFTTFYENSDKYDQTELGISFHPE